MTQQTLWLIESALITQAPEMPFSLPTAVLQDMQVGNTVAIKNIQNSTEDSQDWHLEIQKLGQIQSKNSQTVTITWQHDFQAKTWHYYINRADVWAVKPNHWMNQALFDFLLHDQAQDTAAFLNAAYWQTPNLDLRFAWTEFYQAIATALLSYHSQRQPLLAFVLELAERYQLAYLRGKALSDICPFTVMGMFNRGISSQKRHAIAQDLADFLKLGFAAPHNFDGIPVLNNQSSCFFAVNKSNYSHDVEQLWQFFAVAHAYAQHATQELKQQFKQHYDRVSAQHAVGWNLSMGLFWLAPYQYISLDSQSQQYIQDDLQFKIAKNGAKGRCSGADYLDVLFQLEHDLQSPYSLPRNFPELALYAWEQLGGLKSLANDNDDDLSEVELCLQDLPVQSYSLAQIIAEGCFLGLDTLTQLQQRVLNKKNLILQGASGTGKTWLAKRLAYAVVGHKAQGHVYMMQFHANTSYEDFIRGWRPLTNAQGQHELQLVDGPFLQLIQKALQYPNDRFVMVIEEINRGQTAQIFGEMLTLLESSKRHPHEALSLTYAKAQEKIYIPDNVYLIATMNSADRSLSALDFALRRRFAFATLSPSFNQVWLDYAVQQGLSHRLLRRIQDNMQQLNQEIAENAYLGKAFMLGHSYFTPRMRVVDENIWYQEIIEGEILPLLEQYYLDDVAQFEAWQTRLLDDFA
jgi:5-methylcytosine-specific restriction enzyme B